MKHKHYCMVGVALILTFAAGCATFSKLDETATSLANHPRAIVRYPAISGRTVFGIVPGVPLAVVLAPITVPVGLCSDSDMGGLYVFGPLVFSADVGGVLVGGIPWLVCGWWGRQADAQPSAGGDSTNRADAVCESPQQ